MAKTSAVHRELKRQVIAKRFAERRAELVKVIKDPNASLEEKALAYKKRKIKKI